MKRIYSFIAIVTLFGSSVLAVPVKALIDEGSTDGQTSSKQREIEATRTQKASELSAKLAEVCKRYTETKLGKTTDDKRSEFTSRLSQKGTDLSDKRNEWDTKRTEARLVADQKREEHYTKLLEKALTDEQKQAVEVFKSAVEKVEGEDALKVVDFMGAFQFPNVFYLIFLIKHSVHHRGQLSVYLRPMGGKVPSIYGGSADEPFEMAAASS